MVTRRDLLKSALPVAALGLQAQEQPRPEPGERPAQASGVEVLNPRARVPVSFIIDDSTCLVNLNRFAIPQFRAAWRGTRYHHDWRSMPVEIPDDFVRRFGEWCAEKGVKGKYSIVPFPACMGRLDRELPGWTRQELEASIELVRTLMLPNWDIHSEMVTHTRVIDLKTGHPYPKFGPEWMENWTWADTQSVDNLAAYLAYSLRILKNIGLPCEGITTPGGFASGALRNLSLASLESVREVFGAEIPHYFRHVIASGSRSVAPRVEFASDIGGSDPRCVVSIVACTGDWFGGWDCSRYESPDRFITPDLNAGRMVEVIDRGEPAILLCHWTGIHFNGEEVGFHIFQEVVRRLHQKYDHLLWMKLSEIARYWAAKELTRIEQDGDHIRFAAPYACPQFTVRWKTSGPPRFQNRPLREVADKRALEPGTWTRDTDATIACVNLPTGPSQL